MVLGQYGREVLEWRAGGGGLRGRVSKAVWNDLVRTRVSRSARRGSGEEEERREAESRCWVKEEVML